MRPSFPCCTVSKKPQLTPVGSTSPPQNRSLLEKLAPRSGGSNSPRHPVHARKDDVRSRYGLQFVDPYSWMEEGEGSPDVKRAIEQERAFYNQSLSNDRRLNELADVLYDEYVRYVPEDFEDLNTEMIGPWEYSTVHDEEAEMPRLLRRPAGQVDKEYEVRDFSRFVCMHSASMILV